MAAHSIGPVAALGVEVGALDPVRLAHAGGPPQLGPLPALQLAPNLLIVPLQKPVQSEHHVSVLLVVVVLPLRTSPTPNLLCFLTFICQ